MMYSSFYYDNQIPLDLLREPMPPMEVARIVAVAVFVIAAVAVGNMIFLWKMLAEFAAHKQLNHSFLLDLCDDDYVRRPGAEL